MGMLYHLHNETLWMWVSPSALYELLHPMYPTRVTPKGYSELPERLPTVRVTKVCRAAPVVALDQSEEE